MRKNGFLSGVSFAALLFSNPAGLPRIEADEASSSKAEAPSAAVREAAKSVLDDAVPSARREELIKEHAQESAALLVAMTEDLKAGTPEENRRIPWIWRVAIAGGRRNESQELTKLLEVSLPSVSGQLEEWQAVAIGGGLINGVSLVGVWPAARFEELLKARPDLKPRWAHAIEQASIMADNEKVKTGTRYDALRMLGVEPWDRHGEHLARYLAKGVHPELQQGAISGLADVPGPKTGPALLSGFAHYSAGNRKFALDALVRDKDRISALLDAVADHRVPAEALGEERSQALLKHEDPAVRERAEKLLSK